MAPDGHNWEELSQDFDSLDWSSQSVHFAPEVAA